MPKRFVHTQTFVPNQTGGNPNIRVVHQGVQNGGINVHHHSQVTHQRHVIQANAPTLLQLAQQQQTPTQTMIVPQGTTVVVHKGPRRGPKHF
jgi:hypothetical protein